MRGAFITVEGIDGSGKSTVVDYIQQHHSDVYCTAEPSEHFTGGWASQCIESDETSPLTDFFLLQADRSYHLREEIMPRLESGQTVVCDRYIDSTRAYQRELLQQTDSFADRDGVDACIEPVMSRFIQPNAVIYLDVPADVALDRIDADDSYERRELLESVRSNYISMVDERSEMKRVDAQRSASDVCKGVSNLIELFEADLYDR